MKLVFVLFIGIFAFPSYAQQSFESVTIGEQTWMVENLDVSTFRNGDTIPYAPTADEWLKAGENKQPAWCYYKNDPRNGENYGKLYNWHAVNDSRGLAPGGWHIPNHDEFVELFNNFLVDSMIYINLRWNKFSDEHKSYCKKMAAGARGPQGNFWSNGNCKRYVCWWIKTESSESTLHIWSQFTIFRNYSGGFATEALKGNGFSVRCVKD